MAISLKDMLGNGLEGDIAEEKFKPFFERQEGNPAMKSYIFYRVPVLDENGKHKIHQHKNFVGKVKSEEYLYQIMCEPYENNVIETNQEMYRDLVQANENIITCNKTIVEQNEIIRDLKEKQAQLLAQIESLLNDL